MFKDLHKLDRRTEILIIILEDLIKSSNQENKRIFLEGGFALELELASIRGEDNLSRNHNDIDMHPLEKDIPFWKKWFNERKFIIGDNEEIKDTNKAFVAYSSNFSEEKWEEGVFDAYYIDVYGIKIDDEGNISDSVTGEFCNWDKTWRGMIIQCKWKGMNAYVMRHQDVLERKSIRARELGTPLRKKDLHDHKLFGVSID